MFKYWSPHTLLSQGLTRNVFSGVFTMGAFSFAAVFLRSFLLGGVTGNFDSTYAAITIGVIGISSAIFAIPFGSKVTGRPNLWHNIRSYYLCILIIFALSILLASVIMVLSSEVFGVAILNWISENFDFGDFGSALFFGVVCSSITTTLSYKITESQISLELWSALSYEKYLLFIIYVLVTATMLAFLLA